MRTDQSQAPSRSGVQCWMFDFGRHRPSITRRPFSTLVWLLLPLSSVIPIVPTKPSTALAASHAANQPQFTLLDHLGTVAGKQYHGDGLSVSATPTGAR